MELIVDASGRAVLTGEHYERLLAASSSLAGARDMESFVQTLLARTLEFGRATRAVLVRDQEGVWAVNASAQSTPSAFQFYPGLSLADAQEAGILRVDPVLHVIRTRRTQFDTGPRPRVFEKVRGRDAGGAPAQPSVNGAVAGQIATQQPATAPGMAEQVEPEIELEVVTEVITEIAQELINVLSTPLIFDGRVIAVLYLEKPVDAPGGSSTGATGSATGSATMGTVHGQTSGSLFSELAVQLVARLVQQAAPRLHSLMEMERLAELIQLRREMTEALRASEERFRSIFNSSPVMIFLTDMAGRLLMVNDYWLQALGYSRVEAISQTIGEFCSSSGRTLLAQQIQSDPRPGHRFENLPIQFVRRNGALLEALVSGVILHSEVEGYHQCLSFAIDMTAHRRAEQELDRYRRRLEELVRDRTQELSAANRQLEQDILRRTAAEAQLLRSQQFLQATLDALSEKLAILDASGAIVALNSSWHAGNRESVDKAQSQPVQRQPEQSSGARRALRAVDAGQLAYWHGYQIGADYLTALRGSIFPSAGRPRLEPGGVTHRLKPGSAVEAGVADEVEAGLASLLTGAQDFFQMLYRLEAPGTDVDPGAQIRRQTWYSLRAIRFESGSETYIAVAHDDVTDRKEAEEALLEAAAVNERHRLARELHDSVTQALYSMALFVDATRLALDAGQMERAADNLVELRAMIRGAMESMRALIFELHPPELAEIGLVGALREYLKNYQHRTQIGVGFEISGEEHTLPVRTESELYRVAQEALNNCFKHARADQVTVWLRYQTDGLEMSIADNGQGFDVTLAHLSGGMGVRGMMERIRTIGGRLDVESAPQQGTQIHVRMAYGARLPGGQARG